MDGAGKVSGTPKPESSGLHLAGLGAIPSKQEVVFRPVPTGKCCEIQSRSLVCLLPERIRENLRTVRQFLKKSQPNHPLSA